MKIAYCLFIAVIVLSFSSCQSKKPSSKTILLVKSAWKFADLTSPTPDPNALAALADKKDFLIDQQVTFHEEKTYAITFALATDSSSNATGIWELSSDEKMLKMTSNENVVVWSIGRLDDNVLELKGHDETLKVDVRYVYKRKEL